VQVFRLVTAVSQRLVVQRLGVLGRFQDQRLVGGDDAGDGGGPRVPGRGKEVMASAERGLRTHVGALGRLTQAETVDEGAGVVEPGVATLQLGERVSVCASSVL
jgi:hypothetical protein